VRWISIKSLYGNTLKLELPWEKGIGKSFLNSKTRRISGKIAEIKTKQGEVILIVKEGTDPDKWIIKEESPLPNENVRYHSSGKTRLGIPRMF
jgi:hypothetical protein